MTVKKYDSEWEGVFEDGYQVVPCGKCPECKKKRAFAWMFRLLKEERIHKNSLFVTLTYDENNVPITPKNFMTLRKRDFQLFMKRLRFNTGLKTIKYYAAGEYGDTSWRPHYHAIMYDVPADAIDKAWGLGQIHIGNVTGQSISYTTKYICKDKRVPLHANDDRAPEFSLMSKNLGLNYVNPQTTKWHKEHLASYVVTEGGYEHPLPRYYRDKIFNEEEKLAINQINQMKASEDYNKAIEEAGGSKEFYRIRFDRIKMVVHQQQQNHKRDKI